MRRLLMAIVGVVCAGLSAAPVARADDSSMQARVDAVLASFPGGVQTGANTVEWDGGSVELTLAPEGLSPFAVGSCATGKYCVYNGVSLTGSKLFFSACNTTSSTSAIGTVRSMANARSSGTVQGLSALGAVLTTVSAGGQVNSAPTGIEKVRCNS